MTQIQLIGDIKGFLNLKEDTNCPLTFSISDIKDPSKKRGTFSKTITIVGDKDNNKLLGFYFDVNIDTLTYDINKILLFIYPL